MSFALPMSIRRMLADRARRLHHFIWHQVRNSWFDYPASVRQEITALGWAPPRPAFTAAGEPNLTNNSGQDFLFMHRQMIAHVNQALAALPNNTYGQVDGWDHVPTPSDADYPVPPAYTLPDGDTTERVKSHEYYNRPRNPATQLGGLKANDDLLSDPAVLRRLSLGRLGSLLELTIHNDMHMRWSALPTGFRPEVVANVGATVIDRRWDDPTYDWLGDTYSSHVNDHFWKLHGLIDKRIDQWAQVNQVDPIPWLGTWVGRMPAAPGGHMDLGLNGAPFLFAYSMAELEDEADSGAHSGQHTLSVMEHMVQLIHDCGVYYRFYEERDVRRVGLFDEM